MKQFGFGRGKRRARRSCQPKAIALQAVHCLASYPSRNQDWKSHTGSIKDKKRSPNCTMGRRNCWRIGAGLASEWTKTFTAGLGLAWDTTASFSHAGCKKSKKKSRRSVHAGAGILLTVSRINEEHHFPTAGLGEPWMTK